MKGPRGGGGGGVGGGGADEMANLSNTFDAQTAGGDQRRQDGDMARRRATAYCKAQSKKRRGKLNRRMRAGWRSACFCHVSTDGTCTTAKSQPSKENRKKNPRN